MGHAFTELPKMTEASMAQDRELIEPNEGDKRFVRRDEEGKFKESDDVGRSLSQDRKRDAQTQAKPGQGDKGDRSSSSDSSLGSDNFGSTSSGSTGFGNNPSSGSSGSR
jgi:hypothetical protein